MDITLLIYGSTALFVGIGLGLQSVLGDMFSGIILLFDGSIKVGDIVVLPTMGFTKFEYEGETYWIGKENEVLAKIKKTLNPEQILAQTELTEEDKKALKNE